MNEILTAAGDAELWSLLATVAENMQVLDKQGNVYKFWQIIGKMLIFEIDRRYKEAWKE